MNWIASLVGVFLCVSAFSSEGFDSGVHSLAEKEFDQAIEVFLELAEEQPSEAVFFNLGLSYLGRGEAVNALWAFESALKYNPNGQKAAHNARAIFGELRPDEEWKSPYALSSKLVTFLSARGWLIVSGILSLLLAMALFIALSAVKKTWGRRLANTLIPVSIVCIVLAGWAYQENLAHHSNDYFALVRNHNPPFYLGKDGVPASQVFQLGDRLSIISCEENWCALKTDAGEVFWTTRDQIATY